MNPDSSDDLTPAAVPVASHAAEDTHPDPITGEHGAHPVGVGVGAVSAGLAGAAIGAIAGPIGALVGAAIGVVAGGIAGHEVAASDDEPVSLADQPVPTDGAAEAMLPAAGMAGLQTGGMPGAVLSAAPVIGVPGSAVEEPPGLFHEAFTTTTWREAAAEDQTAGGDETGADPAPSLETWPPATGGASAEFTGAGGTGSEETVRTSAYFRYLDRSATGEPGDALGDWLGAEREVLHL